MTLPDQAARPVVGAEAAGPRHQGDIPVLVARAGGPAERFGAVLGGRRPVVVFLAALLAGFVVLAVLSIALGLLVTDVVVRSGGIGAADERVVSALAGDRTPTLTDASSVGSAIGGAPVLPILAVVVALACALRRRWLLAGTVIAVLVLESATYRVTSWAVPRHRPFVHRLDALPVNDSYPSGHTAATVAVYGGIALLVGSRIRDRRARAVAGALAALVVATVALSRMYRGMHHPLDVAGGLLVGLGAIAVLVFACRAVDGLRR